MATNKLKGVKKLQHYYNQKQAYNKENNIQYFMLNNKDLAKLESKMTDQQKIILEKAFTILDDYSTMIYKSLKTQYHLNQIYGVEKQHYSEKSRDQQRQKYPNQDTTQQ